MLAEQENTTMLFMLNRIAEKVGAKIDDDPSVQVMEQATQPGKVVKQIEETIEQDAAKLKH